MDSSESLLRRVFRAVGVVVLASIGAVLFLFPEPFTSALGICLVLLALAWAGWGAVRTRTSAEPEADG